MKEKIEVTIPLQEFSHVKYQDNKDCYLAIALQEKGYVDVSVGGFGYTTIAGKYYIPMEAFNSEIMQSAFKKRKSITVILQEE